MSDRILKRERIQHLQQQIETWQALLEKLAGNESAIACPHLAKRDRIQQLHFSD
jgi:hypothetical protein